MPVASARIGLIVGSLVAFVVKTQAEGRVTMPKVLQNGTVDNFLSADFVGKIHTVLPRRLKIGG
jgi:hypothetical protein